MLSENSNECIACVKDSFDPSAIPKEPKAYPHRVRRKLNQRDRKSIKIPYKVQGHKAKVIDPGIQIQAGDYTACLKPETITTFKKLYAETKDTLDYLEHFGSKREKAQAIIIRSVVLGSYN